VLFTHSFFLTSSSKSSSAKLSILFSERLTTTTNMATSSNGGGNGSNGSTAATTTTAGIGSVFNAFLAKSNPEYDRLLVACQKNDVELVRELLLEEGVNPSHANPAGQSALHISAWWAHVDCLLLLLEQGANVHAANSLTGATPLHGCIQSSKASLVKSRRLQCIDLLLRGGADPNAKDKLGKRPLDYLAESDIDRSDIVSRLQQPRMGNSISYRNFSDLLRTVTVSLDQVEDCWDKLLHDMVHNSLSASSSSSSSSHDELKSSSSSSLSQSKTMLLPLDVLCKNMVFLLQEWVDQIEEKTSTCAIKDVDDSAHDEDDENDHDDEMQLDCVFYSQRVGWIWHRIMGLLYDQQPPTQGHNDDNSNNHNSSAMTTKATRTTTSNLVSTTRRRGLTILGTEILHRYGYVCKSAVLLYDDIALLTMSQVATLLAMPNHDLDVMKNNSGSGNSTTTPHHLSTSIGTSSNDTSGSNIHQTLVVPDEGLEQSWMIIARRNYFGLAELWWNQLHISPIGVVNRQGMTALQFAARSGHLHMVQWFLEPRSSSSTATMTTTTKVGVSSSGDDSSPSNSNAAELLEWVHHQDDSGQTALSAAVTNQHDEIVRFLEGYIISMSS
jgi:ankyrin repeat protein